MNLIAYRPQQALLRRMATAAFVFFLVKGLLWLAAPLVFILFV